MINIDIQTIIIILFTGNLVALLLFIMQNNEGAMPSGDRFFITGRLFQAAGWMYIAFYEELFDFLPYGTGDILLVAGFACEAAALLSPAESVRKWLMRLCVILTVVALFNLLNPADFKNSYVTGIEAMIFAVPFFVSGFMLCLAWKDSSRLSRMTGIANLLCSLFLLGRSIIFLASGDSLSIPGYVHTMSFMVFFILLAISATSYILFTKEKLEQSLLRETTTDYLTGVSNRRGFESDAAKYVSLAARISIPLSLLMIDVDNFNKINHRFGHAAGDLFLKEFASTVSGILRCYDLVCRYGGEEFVVLLPNTTAEIGRLVAERIRSHADGITIPGFSGLRCSVSVGISIAESGDQKTISKMYDESEAALYRAKKSGRNKVCLAAH
ncbi:MAG: GGDEF domain-containing protein [Spirochaetes bacterium]|nr:GGDEF domain-containing protein [Spirochaetota bacterium]